jgi:hypothetical protein
MKNIDKVLVGFLVAAGLFSVANAVRYVDQLSDDQKQGIYVMAANDDVETAVEPPRVENNKVG